MMMIQMHYANYDDELLQGNSYNYACGLCAMMMMMIMNSENFS